MAGGDAREKAIDELYGLSPEAFTKRRDALAKELRAAGDREGAGVLATLRRPTKVAHLLNQVARRATDEVTALVDLGRELARVQRRAIRGQAGADELRGAIARQREAIADLVKRARAVAAELDLPAGGVVDEVASALRTAMTDPSAGADLEAGRLTHPPEVAVGLPSGDLLGAEGAVERQAAEAASSLRAEASRAEARASELRRAAERAASDAAEAEREARRRAKLAATAERHAAELRRPRRASATSVVAKRPARRRSARATTRRSPSGRAAGSRPTARARARPTREG